LWLACSNTPR